MNYFAVNFKRTLGLVSLLVLAAHFVCPAAQAMEEKGDGK